MSTMASQISGVKKSKLRVIGFCEENAPVSGEFPAQRTNNADNVTTWWRHYEFATECLNS